MVEQRADASLDFVADWAHRFNLLAGRVVAGPVFVTLAGEYGTGVAAAHGDDGISGPDHFVGSGLGVLAGDVDAPLGHSGDGCGIVHADEQEAVGPDAASVLDGLRAQGPVSTMTTPALGSFVRRCNPT